MPAAPGLSAPQRKPLNCFELCLTALERPSLGAESAFAAPGAIAVYHPVPPPFALAALVVSPPSALAFRPIAFEAAPVSQPNLPTVEQESCETLAPYDPVSASIAAEKMLASRPERPCGFPVDPPSSRIAAPFSSRSSAPI